ncbi:MAG: hypothetical protein HOU81_21400 [Hamadaea sp.]|uniref:hypothetical protein n=1 Tax=Hamadaea sp. TaxID=2024425 RepID=UPI00178F3274|nr:hypothetical protein [Hamadaea sp.]NUR73383.1 hypothetical protein [Hamadaea sp.]NUT18530.1 hypothetical protein [Hamadaea sp.]
MSNVQKWGYASFGVGLVLAAGCYIGFAAASGAGVKTTLLVAATVFTVAAANGLGVGIADSVTTGKWVGLIVGAVGFVAWGIAWLATSGALKDSFGWAAVFAAIAALASMLPELFGGSSAPATTN